MINDLREHLEAVRHWIERQGDVPALDAGISAEERKQLQLISKTIAEFTRLGISVPEDVRNLKLRLLNKDASGTANHKVGELIIEVEALIKQLQKLLQAARSLRGRLSATGQTAGTKKVYAVTLHELLQSGHLSTENRFELQWLKDGPTYEGKVQPDGSVMAKTTSGWQHYESLSAAAVDIAGHSLNGWKVWRLINSDGSRRSLEEIRSLYLSKGADQ